MPNFALDPWGKCTYRIPFIPLFPSGLRYEYDWEAPVLSENIRVPEGSPPWITKDDISETIRVWQRYSKARLSSHDALEILVNVRQLLEHMVRGEMDK